MRIKAVCELTGLTDRTVRYYIDEQLITPVYTENYLGRKTFTFTEEDVDQLNHIAVLRKFDFSIEEIRELLAHPERSGRVILDVKARVAATVAQSQEALTALSQLSVNRSYTVAELARALLMPVDTIPMKTDHKPVDIGGFLLDKFGQTLLFIITWLPIVLIVRNSLYSWWSYEYPHISWSSAVGCLAFVWPSIVLLFLHKFKFSRQAWKRRTAKVVLYYFSFWCAFAIGLAGGSVNVVDSSYTTDSDDYMVLDDRCYYIWGTELELFPERGSKTFYGLGGAAVTISDEIDYYYLYKRDSHMHDSHILIYEYENDNEIVMEKHLSLSQYEAEKERVRTLFLRLQESREKDNYTFEEKDIGQYQCLMLYDGAPMFSGKLDNEGHQLVFAYNPSDNTVRYIAFHSQYGVTSHYSTLDWYRYES